MQTSAATHNAVAIGSHALYSASADDTSGTIAIGQAAAYNYAPTAGSAYAGASTVIGYHAGYDDSNTGRGLTTGIQNTAVGHESLGANAGAALTGNANTVMGYRAGYGLHTGGNSNTLMGASAGLGITTGYNNVAMGYNSGASLTTGSYCMSLGSNADNTGGFFNQSAMGNYAVTQNWGETRIGYYGGLQFYSASLSLTGANNSTDTGAAHTGYLFKIPASSIIKSVTLIVTELSNLAVHNVAVYLSTDTSRSLNAALTASGLVEILGAGASATTVSSLVASGGTDPDVVTGTDSGVLNQSYRSTPDIAFGAADKYVWVAAAGTGNTAATISDPPIVRVCVEYIGQD
jgi:hypothetical protein